jgi:hypothetical protein
MKTFDVQAIEINAPYQRTFDFLCEAANLPKWAHAFKEVSGGRALMQTPNGSVEVGLEVRAAREQGTVDWLMTFPDGKVATAFSRVVGAGEAKSLYFFVLTAPPVPLEQLEGALEQQSRTLREELSTLRSVLSK